MILKDVLKPQNKEISSYILKNIVLWQGERNPQTQFHPCSLLHWLHDGLTELRTAIAKQHLQYYMIPERNLMEACGMTDVLQHKWVADITDMLEEGPGVILRLEKIRKAIIAFTWPMQWFSKKRMQIEMLRLEESIRALKCRDANKVLNDSDFMLNAIWIRLEREYEEVKTLMLLEGSSVNALEDIHRKILM
ncbi:hypothetical protein DPMN_040248 [Dreissena polymorpha]|uniref:Mab-21-like HhH/H2TH-like domain-containing protein n=1 Tax=Dreissena polymorpha TaxID=45954 RepID=A0A9D4CUP0_DREPO|nr:hypothetical protein DPMN_040248 [Dreissena polymorpha]